MAQLSHAGNYRTEPADAWKRLKFKPRNRKQLAILIAVAAWLFVDAYDGELMFPLRLFGAVLLAEGFMMLLAGFATSGLRRPG